ncbi:hypothetical protein VTN77DRAFT_9753 [Rasamsonia byssochlamydoides]|uniref:uncharacterized protein n=1 Tax=Rasamsonia byssochlamydoides TaxID=89139 RepID=UPI003742C8FF
MRVVGFIMLGTHIPSVLFFQSRLPPRKTGALVEWAAFKEVPYMAFILSFFFNFWGLYFVFLYIGTSARDRVGIADSINLVMVLNGVGVVGRIVPNLVGDRLTGTLNLLVPCSFAAAILVYCWAAVKTATGLWVFTVIYGIIAAAAQSLFPATATVLVTDLRKAGTRVGMVLTVVSFATLTGPAIEGALIQCNRGGLSVRPDLCRNLDSDRCCGSDCGESCKGGLEIESQGLICCIV